MTIRYRNLPWVPRSVDGLVVWAQDLTGEIQTILFDIELITENRILSGTTANIPAATGSNNLYYDTTAGVLKVDLAGGWTVVSGGGGGDYHIDGGTASSIYTSDQLIDGGGA